MIDSGLGPFFLMICVIAGRLARMFWVNIDLNTLRPRQNGPHFAEDLFNLNEDV